MKELKSKYDDLRRYFETAIIVGHVAEGLECCDENDDAAKVRGRMKSRDFDVMGLKISGIVEGYVCEECLTDGTSCKEYLKPFLFPVSTSWTEVSD